jgi:Icc-related predicted phosphoesterase
MLPLLIQTEEPDLIFYCGGSMRGQVRQEEYETARRFHSKPDLDSPIIQKEVQEYSIHLQQFLLALADSQKTVYEIPGLGDAPESLYFKTIYNLTSIYPNLQPAHEMLHRTDAFSVAGFGGDISLSDDQRELILQYSKTWAEFSLRRLQYFPGEKILLFHTPPVCRLDLSEGEHCGMLLINEIIEAVSPSLVVCGRATSGQGTIKMGKTTVVNPGPLFKGNYAVVDFPSMETRFGNLDNL